MPESNFFSLEECSTPPSKTLKCRRSRVLLLLLSIAVAPSLKTTKLTKKNKVLVLTKKLKSTEGLLQSRNNKFVQLKEVIN
jgi:hypothetical protein